MDCGKLSTLGANFFKGKNILDPIPIIIVKLSSGFPAAFRFAVCHCELLSCSLL
jgi:hypothetical protein